MGAIINNLQQIFSNSGYSEILTAVGGYRYAVMLLVACILIYLAIVHQFEPLLLLPIGFGMLMANLPLDGIIHMDIFINETGHINWQMLGSSGGLADYIYLGVKLGIYPPLIFLGIGTMTDFEPLIARPSSLLLGAAAQLGIFVAYTGARVLGFSPAEAASIGIIGGADGPTAILTTSILAPELLGSVAVAAYCYMALVPVIQPPIMRLLTTEKERQIIMEAPRKVSHTEKVLFPIVVTILVSLLLPDAAILVGCLMMGNLMKECGVVERITKTAGNELMNIITIFLGFSVGCTTNAETFLNMRQDQPPHRLRRCFRRSHGRPCFSEGWPGVQPPQLSADARHGPQRGRRYRQRCGGRYPHQYVPRYVISFFAAAFRTAGPSGPAVLLCASLFAAIG